MHQFYNQVLNSTDLQCAILLYHETAVITAKTKSYAVWAANEVNWDWTEETVILYTWRQSLKFINKIIYALLQKSH